MPTDTERRLEALENLLLFGGGVTAATATGRQLASRTGVGAARAVGRLGIAAAQQPAIRSVILGNIANQAAIAYEEALLEEQGIEPAVPLQLQQPGLREASLVGIAGYKAGKRRKVSKANKAVKRAVDLLRAGTKGATGADKGKLPKNYWKMATTAAGLANPNTPSKITKGTTKVKRLARTLRNWW